MSKTGDTNHAIDELARALPPFRPDDARAERVRTETLARVSELAATAVPPRRVRAAWIALPVAAAAGLVWFLLARRHETGLQPASPTAATPALQTAPAEVEEVHPREGARFERSADGIELRHGGLEIEVSHSGNDKPIRIATSDVTITAQAARFEVEARDERLVAVMVHEGRVEMQSSADRTPRVIVAGEVWNAPIEPEEEARHAPAATPRQNRKEIATATPPAKTPPPVAAPGEVEFRAGWAALRAGKARAAADSFAQARGAAGDSGLGEDAHFWHGIALARTGDRARAIQVLREFTAEHPRSARAGEASAKLGWLLYEAGRLDDAARAFQSAAGDRVPQVKKSARDGLEAIDRRRGNQDGGR